MGEGVVNRNRLRMKRALRVRKRLRGSLEKPRLSVYKSLNHMGCQLIDDSNGVTLACVTTYSKALHPAKKSKDSARLLGAKLAELAIAQGISKVVFDRGRFRHHGLLKCLADAVRDGGVNV